MKYYRDKYRKRKKRKAVLFLSVFLSFVVLSFVYVYCVVNPVVIEATSHTIYSLSTSAVSNAVYDVLVKNNISYEDLVNIEYNDSGDITLISLETVELNLLTREFYKVSQDYLDAMGSEGIDVSLGTFSGIPFLSGLGPKINLKLVSIGAMTASFESEFVSAGINQTNHSLYVKLYASVSLILPAYTERVDSVTEMLVAESVIVGKVPQVYLSGGSLNFSPN